MGTNGTSEDGVDPLSSRENNERDDYTMNGIALGASRAEPSHPDLHPAYRIWLQDRGAPVFGAGICELLRRVEETGSLRRAASDMGMAYSKAWQIVRRAEAHLGLELMVRRTGGKGGGCSLVSDEGKWLVGAFGAMDREAAAFLDELFARHLGRLCRPAGELRAIGDAENLRGEQ